MSTDGGVEVPADRRYATSGPCPAAVAVAEAQDPLACRTGTGGIALLERVYAHYPIQAHVFDVAYKIRTVERHELNVMHVQVLCDLLTASVSKRHCAVPSKILLRFRYQHDIRPPPWQHGCVRQDVAGLPEGDCRWSESADSRVLLAHNVGCSSADPGQWQHRYSDVPACCVASVGRVLVLSLRLCRAQSTGNAVYNTGLCNRRHAIPPSCIASRQFPTHTLWRRKQRARSIRQ